jgi:hypothetical protein
VKNLTQSKLAGINLGALAVLAPLMIEAPNYLPPKYLGIAMILVQIGNWLMQHKALKSPSPNLASRRALKTALDIAHERSKDANVASRELYKQDITELTGAQMSSLINYLKGARKGNPSKGNVPNAPWIPPIPPPATNEEAVAALRESEAGDG